MESPEPLPIPDSSYRTCWRKFCAFVNDHRDGPTPSPSGMIQQYLCRANVDLFFRQVIPTMGVNPDSVQRYISALQWYADKIEFAEERLEPGEQPFDVDSPEVQKALNKYANAYLIKYQMTNHNAHQGLPTSILSVDEHRRVIHHLMQKKFRHWKDFGILWNMCQATFIHQDTCRQL